MKVEQNADKPGISLAREVRGQILVWIGIVGGTITIIGRLGDFVTLADWLQELARHWVIFLHVFWDYLASFLHINISEQAASFFSFVAFYLIIFVGSLALGSAHQNPQKGFSFVVTMFITQVSSLPIVLLLYNEYLRYYLSPIDRDTVLVLWASVGAVLAVALFADDRTISKTLLAILILILFALNLYLFHSHLAFTLASADLPAWVASLVNLAFFYFFLLILTLPAAYASTLALIRHIAFLLIGVALIFGLSEVSKQVEKLRTAASTIEAHYA